MLAALLPPAVSARFAAKRRYFFPILPQLANRNNPFRETDKRDATVWYMDGTLSSDVVAGDLLRLRLGRRDLLRCRFIAVRRLFRSRAKEVKQRQLNRIASDFLAFDIKVSMSHDTIIVNR